jgi:RNA 3'-terminal phosphate cyclase (ATP)
VRHLIPLDGAEGEGGGQILRTALSLAVATGQGFELGRIRARRARPGLRPQHVAAVRAATLACGARASGAFEGSPELRFEPQAVAAGDYHFEIGSAGAATLVVQALLPALARAGSASSLVVSGGTHVPLSPSFEFAALHWLPVLRELGIGARLELERAGFYPRGGGGVRGRVEPRQRPGAPLAMESRGALVGVQVVSGVARLRGDVAERQAAAAAKRLWDERRLEPEVQVVRSQGAAPGSYLFARAAFERGGAGIGLIGERRVRPEALGDRAARRLLKFLDQPAAVDPFLADQLAVPLALSGAGGRVSTPEVTRHLETVASVVRQFGIEARTWGQLGGPGGLEVGRAG